MSRTFKVGDLVRIIGCKRPENLRYLGEETVVTGVLFNRYEVDLLDPAYGLPALIAPQHLELIYDGNQTVAWSSCEWQPKAVCA